MLIDHLKREILVKEEELMASEAGFTIENLDQSCTIFFTTIEQSKILPVFFGFTPGSEIPEILIKLKSLTPAYLYLSRYDIHDYKVILHKGQHLT
jgi:hypothetical protein